MNIDSDRFKRPRSPSVSSVSSSSSSNSFSSPFSPSISLPCHTPTSTSTIERVERSTKYYRHDDSVPPGLGRGEKAETYLCTLPPTCSQPHTSQVFKSLQELESHQMNFHRWVCRIPVRDKPGRQGGILLSPTTVKTNIISKPNTDFDTFEDDGNEGGRINNGGGDGDENRISTNRIQQSLNEIIRRSESGGVPEGFRGRMTNMGRWRECGKVFPDSRLLDLHVIETHDPIFRERQAKGEKIFQCFLDPSICGKTFKSPKKRRYHLIEKHHYPSTYFFSITNHGINQIAREDGLAASLIRPKKDHPRPPLSQSSSQAQTSHPQPPYSNLNSIPHPNIPSPPQGSIPTHDSWNQATTSTSMELDAMDQLADQLGQSSLDLVPRSVTRKTRSQAKQTKSGS